MIAMVAKKKRTVSRFGSKAIRRAKACAEKVRPIRSKAERAKMMTSCMRGERIVKKNGELCVAIPSKRRTTKRKTTKRRTTTSKRKTIKRKKTTKKRGGKRKVTRKKTTTKRKTTKKRRPLPKKTTRGRAQDRRRKSQEPWEKAYRRKKRAAKRRR